MIEKINPNETIIQIVDSINKDDKESVYTYTKKYVDSLPQSNQYVGRMIRVLKERPMKMISLNDLSNDLKSLLIQKNNDVENVYLKPSLERLIDELLIEWNNKEIYEHHKIGVRRKILLYGDTGNGKTTIAKYIAKLSNLPFVEINSDMMIDSKLGNTSYNIHKILNGISESCVLFWDEVDTIGRARGKGGDSAASLENERMINSILINLEKLNKDIIFIGATNRYDVLDTAFLRRFDIKYEISNPNEIEKQNFAKQMNDYYNLPFDFYNDYFRLNTNLYKNFSEIKNAYLDYARKYIAEKIKEEVNND